MNLNQIKEKLASSEYDFLRNHPDLGNNIILLTLGGSHAYGLETESSDLDVRGIYLNSKEEILSMKCKEKPVVNVETDTSVYPLKHMIKLLTDCNPNVIEIVGTKEEHLFIFKPEGKLIRDNAQIFLSRKLAYTFGGYATSQMRRLKNAIARDEYPQAEKEQHILESIQGQRVHVETNYTSFENDKIKTYIDKSNKVDFDTEIFVDIDLKHYPLRDLKSMINDMYNVVRDYESVGHRNNKKDIPHLNKHIMHTLRSIIMGTEILEGKSINTYREHDKDFFYKLRNGYYVKDNDGKLDYSDVFLIVEEYTKKFHYAVENTVLPNQPDYNAINELVMEINRGVVK